MTLRFALLQARNSGDRARDDEIAAFAAQLRVESARIQPVDILHQDPVSASAGADVILVGGAGEYSVLDDLPAIRRFVDGLAELATSGRPVFASCFGFQALVLGLGGQVIPDPDNAEVGSYELQRTPAAAQDPLVASLPDRFWAQLGHKDRAVVLPDGVVHLASSERAPFQALSIPGYPVYATQFHPELTARDNQERFRAYFAHYSKLFGPEEAQARLDGHRPSPQANALMRRFVDEIVRA